MNEMNVLMLLVWWRHSHSLGDMDQCIDKEVGANSDHGSLNCFPGRRQRPGPLCRAWPGPATAITGAGSKQQSNVDMILRLLLG